MHVPPQRAAAALSLVLAALLPVIGFGFASMTAQEAETRQNPVVTVAHVIPPFSRDAVSEDVLWLARCIYSETKRAPEQELVAWVIRNRVETGYRGQRSYEGAVLDPYQFSAFNPGTGSPTPQGGSRPSKWPTRSTTRQPRIARSLRPLATSTVSARWSVAGPPRGRKEKRPFSPSASARTHAASASTARSPRRR